MMSWRLRQNGFTLIEAMVALAILTFLVSLAIPNYYAYVVRSNRTEAIEGLMAGSACQERLFIRNNAYNAAACGGLTNNGFYNITFATSNGNLNFVATAAPQGSQTDDNCGTLTISDTGVKQAEGQTGTFAQRCWAGKHAVGGS